MYLYNTLSKKIEKFIPYDPNEIKMYTCGPTVYDYAHVGNLRTYIFEDILEKTLKYNGYNVKRLINITDVGHIVHDADVGEDKMLVGAEREHKTVYEIADFYTKSFFDDFVKLNIKKPALVEKASDHISEYIEIISYLLDKDIAYVANGNVYFDVTKSSNYYELSGKNKEELMVAVRDEVTEDTSKKNPNDFVLWFTNSKFENQVMQWDSPWGRGYPGWHIECSGLALNYLGDHLDIHCGGVDNIFPHHTNEIAQSEAYLGTKWCNYWVHGEFLNDTTGKMSKSSGEFLTLEVLIKQGFKPIVYRFYCLLSHYRKQLVYSLEGMQSATSAYNKLLGKIKAIKNDPSGKLEPEIFNKYRELFKEAISDDLNVANAITVLYDLLKDDVTNKTKLEIIKSFDTVLSLDLLKDDVVNDDLTAYINAKIEERNTFKANKDYAKADLIRKELLEKGIEVKDTKEGTTYEIIK